MSSKKYYRPLTVFCVRCKHQMTCPSNAGIIQCTKCCKIQDVMFEYDVKCNGCTRTLTHPITARIIQCPFCSTFMDVSDPDLSSMDLIQIQHPSKKRKLNKLKNNNTENNHYETETDSNTTVTIDSNINKSNLSNCNYGTEPNEKRRKIGNMKMYNEQWIEYELNNRNRFQPNRPNNNLIDLNTKNSNIHLQQLKQSKSDFKYHKKKKKKNHNNKYGSFDMTPITFI
eukprot:231796_1